ncbi:beta-microseminoprotein-like [Aquarana catesbeiana]|uniref:beta-microseminoprotein-like n=1 Tax=Aquarana catesbeiana TaxID=8400 RepID=UPI003CC9B343
MKTHLCSTNDRPIETTPTMDYLLPALLVMGMVSLCGAQCDTEHCTKVLRDPHKHALKVTRDCVKNGVHHEKGEEWIEKDCSSCSCDGEHIDCCFKFAKPVIEDPANCEAVLNKETCKYEVRQKGDKPCKVDSWIS